MDRHDRQTWWTDVTDGWTWQTDGRDRGTDVTEGRDRQTWKRREGMGRWESTAVGQAAGPVWQWIWTIQTVKQPIRWLLLARNQSHERNSLNSKKITRYPAKKYILFAFLPFWKSVNIVCCLHFLQHRQTNNSPVFVFVFAFIRSHFYARMETLIVTNLLRIIFKREKLVVR